MSPISFEDAYAQTASDPKAYGLVEGTTDDAVNQRREEAARRIVAGVAAGDVYWASRGRLEALEAQSQGHGQVVRGSDAPDSAALGGGVATEPAIDSTAEDEPPAVEAGDAEDRLRRQLRNAGIEPEA